MSGSLGQLVVSLAADVGLFESDMGKAARIAERETSRIASTTKGIGKSLGDIGRAVSTVGLGGFEKLGDGAKAATAAIKGLGAATLLIGVASWPVAAITAAAAALGYFISNSNDAADAAEELAKRIDKLRQSKEQLALAPLVEDQKKVAQSIETVTARMRVLETAMEQARKDQERWKETSSAGSKALDTSGIALARYAKEHEDLRQQLIKLERDALTVNDAIGKKTTEAAQDATQAVTRYRDALAEQVGTFGQGAEAAARYALEHGDLAKTIKDMGPAGKEAAEAILKYAKELDALNAAKADAIRLEREHQAQLDDLSRWYDQADAELKAQDRDAKALGESIKRYLNPAMYDYEQRLKDVDQALRDQTISEEQATAARAKAAKELADANSRAADNEFARQAARNIQGITASLIAGEMSARSFGQAVVDSLKRIAAELAAQALLRQLFGSFAGTGGVLGGFADAVLGKHADGGAYKAGRMRLTGERGPELDVPANSGVVIPNHQMGGLGGVVFQPNSVSIDARGAMDPTAMLRGLAAFKEGIINDVAAQQQRGIVR